MSATILPFVRPRAEAIMALHCEVPPSAMTAELLGTKREAHAVQVSADGLMLAAGYSILEAAEVWVTNRRGQSAEAAVLAHDFDSGLALIRPSVPLGHTFLELAPLDSVALGDEVDILTSDSDKPMRAAIFARQEFAGRWEYLLEEALYTLPLCEHWSGAALLNKEGALVGLGSLAIGLSVDDKVVGGNLFIPVELVAPHLRYMAEHGETPHRRRPWLGVLVEEHETELHVVGMYDDAPAAQAGIVPGDVILAVRRQPVATLAGLFRAVWQQGPAGVRVQLTVRSGDEERELTVHSTDRNAFFIRRESAPIN